MERASAEKNVRIEARDNLIIFYRLEHPTATVFGQSRGMSPASGPRFDTPMNLKFLSQNPDKQ